jgi:hypothetical protein
VSRPLTFFVGGERREVTEFSYQGQVGHRRDIFTATDAQDRKFHVRLPDWKSYRFELVPA